MTYEEISTKYPVGKLLYRTVEEKIRKGHWITEQDKTFFRSKYQDCLFSTNGEVYYTETIIQVKSVEGRIFDGYEWSVTEDGWDGWTTIDKDELERYEKLGVAPLPERSKYGRF